MAVTAERLRQKSARDRTPGRNRSPRLIHVIVVLVTVVPAALIGDMAWRACGSHGERCKGAGRYWPEYDPSTGRITLVMHDLSGNGIVDAWVHRNDGRIERIDIDPDEDGTTDRRLVLDEAHNRWRIETEPETEPPAPGIPDADTDTANTMSHR